MTRRKRVCGERGNITGVDESRTGSGVGPVLCETIATRAAHGGGKWRMNHERRG